MKETHKKYFQKLLMHKGEMNSSVSVVRATSVSNAGVFLNFVVWRSSLVGGMTWRWQLIGSKRSRKKRWGASWSQQAENW